MFYARGANLTLHLQKSNRGKTGRKPKIKIINDIGNVQIVTHAVNVYVVIIYLPYSGKKKIYEANLQLK